MHPHPPFKKLCFGLELPHMTLGLLYELNKCLRNIHENTQLKRRENPKFQGYLLEFAELHTLATCFPCIQYITQTSI